MKKLFLILTISSFISVTSCKDNNASNKVKSENVEQAVERDAADMNKAVLTFEQNEHDFGTITQGQRVEKVFKFKNTGEAPLLITDAKSSCGCTVPEYTNKPVAPGESGELLVRFHATAANQVTKTVTITANTERGKEYLKIKAFVEPKEQEATN